MFTCHQAQLRAKWYGHSLGAVIARAVCMCTCRETTQTDELAGLPATRLHVKGKLMQVLRVWIWETKTWCFLILSSILFTFVIFKEKKLRCCFSKVFLRQFEGDGSMQLMSRKSESRLGHCYWMYLPCCIVVSLEIRLAPSVHWWKLRCCLQTLFTDNS